MKSISRFFIVAIVVGIIGCVAPPPRDFADADLLIGISNLPENWKIAEFGELDEEEGQISSAYIDFYATDTSLFVRSGEDIYHYPSSYKASRHYKRMLPLWQGTSVRGTEWQTPESFSFSSRIANRWHFACQKYYSPFGPEFGEESTICAFLAQYEEFIVRFIVPLQVDERQYFTLGEVELIIEAIDQRVETYLQREE